jgi:prepilin-type N-terminal cleavage/methylation domain-containing protein
MMRRLDTRILRAADGFTMVELLVTMILLLILFFAAFAALANLSRTSRATQSAGISQTEARSISILLASDLARARAPLRAASSTADQSASIVDDLSNANPLAHDIYHAGPTAIVFFADVIPNTATSMVSRGPEVVAYYLEGQIGAATVAAAPAVPGTPARTSNHCTLLDNEWCLVREVDLLSGTPVTRTTTAVSWARRNTEVLAHGTQPFPKTDKCAHQDGVETYPIDYRLLCYAFAAPQGENYIVAENGNGWTSTCLRQWTAPTKGANYNVTPVTITADTPIPAAPYDTYSKPLGGGPVTRQIFSLDRIVDVGIVLPSQSNSSGAATLSRVPASLALRNRQTTDYLRTIQCGLVT